MLLVPTVLTRPHVRTPVHSSAHPPAVRHPCLPAAQLTKPPALRTVRPSSRPQLINPPAVRPARPSSRSAHEQPLCRLKVTSSGCGRTDILEEIGTKYKLERMDDDERSMGRLCVINNIPGSRSIFCSRTERRRV